MGTDDYTPTGMGINGWIVRSVISRYLSILDSGTDTDRHSCRTATGAKSTDTNPCRRYLHSNQDEESENEL